MKKNKTVDFDRFLNTAREREKPQKVLLVFVKKELRDDTGVISLYKDFSLNPFMYVDKDVDMDTNFNSLRDESLEAGEMWDLVYVTVLESHDVPPQLIEDRLQLMIKFIHQGETDNFLVFDEHGSIYNLEKITVQ